jgi:magnesium transporter
MRKFLKSRAQKAGLPPGSPVHIGERKEGARAAFILTYYEESVFERRELGSLAEAQASLSRPGVTWVHIVGVNEVRDVEQFSCFGLHPLVIEDILNTDQRTKYEDYGDYAYLVVKMLSDEGKAGVGLEQVSVVLGRNFVVSVEESPSGAFESVLAIVEKNRGRVRKAGADFLAYLLVDKVVDNYFLVLEKLGDRIDTLQDELVSKPTPHTLRALHELRRETLLVRKSIWPLREVVAGLERERSSLFHQETWLYLRDLYDHTIHIVDNIETFREMLAGMLDIYLSSVSNRMNEIMKVLTIIATVFMPLTFIVSFYGMNFRYMPGLDWRWGFAAVLIVCASIALGMMRYFRKKGWF